MDVLTAEQRHYNMSRIRSKDTKPELTVRKWLWHHGYRYRLHRKNLPGKPDIVLPKYHAVVFVHGCFWHRHGCKLTSTPATRKEFWEVKLNGNAERDKRNIQKIRELNWRVLVIWECEIKKWDSVLETKILDFLHSDTDQRNSDNIYADDQPVFKIAAEQESIYSPDEIKGIIDK
jgi:DNA mismatch endonuclease (patch repair protein)